ncbi:MAG: J domain-containing protein [Pseudomonadota bacterium]
MDARDLQQIDAFLTDVGQASLLEYYGVEPDTPSDEIAARLRSRRSWAQAQQSNPKYRFQALWLIKNNALVQRVMLQEQRAYMEAVAARERDRKLQMLDLFVQGSLVSGRLTDEAEAAIRRQAHEMGLSDAETSRYLDTKVGTGEPDQESLFEPAQQEPSPEDDFVDHYELLQVSPQATEEEIEEAYRERYRWARTLKDLQRANDIYQQLEQAWRVLSDTGRRREYDDRRRAREARSEAATPSPPVQVPRVLRATQPSAVSADDTDLSIEDDETAERPSEIQLGRPRWASDGQDDQPAAAAPPPAPAPLVDELSLPQPPAPGAVRSFQPGTPEAPARPHHTPRLRVEGPDQMTLTLGLSNQVRTIKVVNGGRGRLRGNVASSQPWLQVSPRTLHIKDEPQIIELTAIPRRLGGQSGRARVTISTTHGERWAITIDAHRRRIGAWVAATTALVLLALLALARNHLLPWDIPYITPPRPHAVRTLLKVEVEPPNARIFLNDDDAGVGPMRYLEDPVLPGRPLELKVTAPNTQPYVETLVFVDGQRIQRNVRLVVGPDPPSWAEDPETGRHLITAVAPRPEPLPRVEPPTPEPSDPASPDQGAPPEGGPATPQPAEPSP